jgi:maltose alpha-D-glucosyltransferase/alpha-amylase
MTEPWFRNALIYSLSVETFMDGNGDGVGDFNGLLRRLDYLESLGVDVLWLAPTQPSPWRDDGYDITDYYGIDPRLGTPGEFAELVREAGARGMRVLMDLVVNHTSNRHPWFLDAVSAAASDYRDWYVWSETRPKDLRSGIVFPGVQDSTWSRDPKARAWYFHRFYDFQPDLNMQNPRVREEIHRVVSFWLQLGVAGFRVDAVPFILEKPKPDGGRATLDFAYLRELRDVVQWQRGDGVLLGEANVVPRDDAEYFEDGRGLHMMFNFWVNQHLFAALATRDARLLADALESTRDIPDSAQWAYFLRNHDELDLGRLSARLRKKVFAAFAPEPAMQLYDRGIRRRLAPMLNDRRRLELAYSLMFSLPGAPVLRYGEEIGMGENLRLRERNAIRTPMQWSSGLNGGFSTADELVRPPIATGPFGYEAVNVDDQLRDPSSLLRWMIGMIRVRKECPEIGAHDWEVLPTGNRQVLATLHGGNVLCVHNLGDRGAEVALDLDPSREWRNLLENGGHSSGDVRLEPCGYAWYRAG